MRNITLGAAVAFAMAAPAAHADDLKALREEIAQMKQSYEQRIAALEARLAQAEAAARPVAAASAPAAAPSRTAAGGGFNPDISLILQGRATRMQEVPERGITGFWPAGGHDHGGPERGFSLDHSELVVSANVDPHFRGLLNVAMKDGETGVEEAWFQTLGLGRGFTLKGGRFLSGIGYLNEQHPHAWDFADAPLMTRVLFGEHYAQDGVQLKWVAPTDLFLEVGAEMGRGAAFPGTDRNKNGNGGGALFAHLGGDVGAAHSWRAGLSWLGTRAADRATHLEDTDPAGANEVTGLFTGRSRTWLADFVWKWTPGGGRSVKLQAELFRRTEDGSFACLADAAAAPGSPCAAGPSAGYRSRQQGYYAQGVWQFAPAWRTGYRYDRLDSGHLAAGLVDAGALDSGAGPLAAYRPSRHSLMLDWSPSEFSRLRLQFARDRSMAGIDDNQVTLQYILSLGSHGAHRY